MVPIDSVIDDAEGSLIFVYDGETETVSKRQVKVGEVQEDRIQIFDGLKDGELVVINGQYGLLDGEKVNARRVEEND